jgi:multiple sugar transport system substrate-binding protein
MRLSFYLQLVKDAIAKVAQPSNASVATPLRLDGFPNYDTHFAAVLPEFVAKNSDIDVKLVMNIHDDHHKKLASNLTTGTGAGDVVLVDVARLGSFLNEGGFSDLAQAPFHAERLEAQFTEYAWAQGRGADGKLHAVPLDIGPAVLYYRRDCVEARAYQIDDVVRSWESYFDFGSKLKFERGIPLLSYAGDIAELVVNATTQAHEGIYFDADGNSLLKSERFLKAFRLAKRARDLGLDQNIRSFSEEWCAMVRQGRVATQLSGAWLLGHLQNWIAPDAAGIWGASRLPDGIFGSWGGCFLAIPKQSRYPAAAWRLIEFLISPEVQLKGLELISAFPANRNSFSDESFNAPIRYLAGQRARQLFSDLAGKVHAVRTHKGDHIAFRVFQNALDEVFMKGESVEAALDSADAALRRRVQALR